jgi:hypothetical protein
MSDAKKPTRTVEEVLSEIIRPAKGILFLSRVLRWWPHAKRQVSGKFWIYKSRRDWCAEIGVELKTLERYITILRKGDWIETVALERLNAAGMAYGEKIQHVRPTEKLIAFVAEGTGKSFERPKKIGLTGTSTPPQNLGGPPLKNEGHPPSKMGDHKKETSSLSKKKQKKEHKSGTVQTNDASPVSPLSGKKEDAPTAHPGNSLLTPSPQGASGSIGKAAKRFVVLSGAPEDIADPFEHL